MRKTIDLTEKDIKLVDEYQKRNGLKNFSEAMRNIVRGMDSCTCGDTDVSDDNFALIADALVKINDNTEKINEKIDLMLPNIAPKAAGEVK